MMFVIDSSKLTDPPYSSLESSPDLMQAPLRTSKKARYSGLFLDVYGFFAVFKSS